MKLVLRLHPDEGPKEEPHVSVPSPPRIEPPHHIRVVRHVYHHTVLPLTTLGGGEGDVRDEFRDGDHDVRLVRVVPVFPFARQDGGRRASYRLFRDKMPFLCPHPDGPPGPQHAFLRLSVRLQ